MNFRPATLDDLIAFNGKKPATTMRAFVAEHEGKVLAVGGMHYTGGSLFAFSELSDEMRSHRKSILRAARYVIEKAKAMNLPVFAICSKSEPSAPAFLARLGFGYVSTTEAGDLYRLES
jgi:N-acetylglutamate synthase-like GNAT family acetyltransferase